MSDPLISEYPDEPGRVQHILEILRETYPDAKTELSHRNPFELLISTILSAQATDKSVNAATPALFARYPGRPQHGAGRHRTSLSHLLKVSVYTVTRPKTAWRLQKF